MKIFNILLATHVAMLILTSTSVFSQNEQTLLDRILKNPEYQNDWNALKQMRKDGIEDDKIVNWLNDKELKKIKQAKEMKAMEHKKYGTEFIPFSSCNPSDIGAEAGNFGTWTGEAGCNNAGNPGGCPFVPFGGVALPYGNRMTIPAAGNDPCADVPGFPITLPAPLGGNFSIRLGNNETPFYNPPPLSGEERISHTFVVQPTDTSFVYQYAVVLEDPGHVPANQPFFDFVIIETLTGDTIACSYQHYVAGGIIPGFQQSLVSNAACITHPPSSVYYKPWTTVGVNLSGYVGQQVTIICTTSDCTQCGHFAYTYLDFSCGTITPTQFCVGEDSVLLTAPYESGFSYSWTSVSPGFSSTNDSVIVDPNVYDTLIVYVTPPSGCSFSLVYHLLPTSINPGFTYTVNCNNSVTFTDTSGITGGTLTGWQWNFQSGTPSSFNGQNPGSVTFPGPGTYTVMLELTSQAGCKDTTIAVPITILPPPVITANNVSICQNSTDTICASPGFTYLWNPSGQTTSCIIVTTTVASYTVIGTDANGCTASAIANVNTIAPPTITATGGQICANSCTPISAGGAGVNGSYVWTPTTGLSNNTISNPTACPPGPTTYTVVGTDVNGCSNSDTATVSILSNPSISAGPNGTICYGRDSSQISASGGVSYVWTPSAGLSCTNCPNPWADPLFSNTYTVTGTDANGCTNTATVSITVGAIPFVSAIAPTTICNGDSAQLFANTSNGLQPYSYYWFPPNDLNNPNQQNPVAGPANNTPYTVVVTDANGCTDDTTTYVYVQTVPSVTWASWTPKLTCDGIVMPFLANASSNAQTVYWNFGDGTTITIPVTGDTISVPHTYPYGSTYSVTLVVFNPPCSDTLDTTMVVSDVMQYINILPANVFTPNGDNQNDCFHPAMCDLSAITATTTCPQTTLVEELKACLIMEIYDRWGVKMFETTDSEKCWDGKNLKGKDAVEGTYYYISKFGDIPMRGYVTLLRKVN